MTTADGGRRTVRPPEEAAASAWHEHSEASLGDVHEFGIVEYMRSLSRH